MTTALIIETFGRFSFIADLVRGLAVGLGMPPSASPVGDAVPTGIGMVAAVFLLSGFSKVRRPFAAALAIARFGLLPNVNVWAGRAAGAVEIAIAVALILWPSLVLPLVAASALLVVFVALIAKALVRGDKFHCACFGARGEPIAVTTLARTLALLGVAGGCLVLIVGGVPRPTEVDRVLGLCSGGVVVALAALLVEIRRTAPFGQRFTSNG